MKEVKVKLLFLLILSIQSFDQYALSQNTFNILDYGAVPDEK